MPDTRTELLRSYLTRRLEDATNFVSLFVRDVDGSDRLTVAVSGDDPLLFTVNGPHGSHETANEQTVLDTILQTATAAETIVTCYGRRDLLRLRVRERGLDVSRAPPEPPPQLDAEWAVGKMTHLDIRRSAPLLQAIGLMTDTGHIRGPMRKKFKQINHFLELVKKPIRKLEHRKPLGVLDCGCGKSYLGFVFYHFVHDILGIPLRFWGVDQDEKLIRQCWERKQILAYSGMEFRAQSIHGFRPSGRVDVLLSLHACDTATDEAIALGLSLQVPLMLLVPCCQQELNTQLNPEHLHSVIKHGLFRERLADLFTDVLRVLFLEGHGYRVTPMEFVSPLETPKNLLIKAERQPKAKIDLGKYRDLRDYLGVQPSLEPLTSALAGSTVE